MDHNEISNVKFDIAKYLHSIKKNKNNLISLINKYDDSNWDNEYKCPKVKTNDIHLNSLINKYKNYEDKDFAKNKLDKLMNSYC